VGATEHRALPCLQLVDLPFNLALAPRESQGGLHGRVVAANTVSEGPEFWQATRLGALQPAFQSIGGALSQERLKGSGETVCVCNRRAFRLNNREESLISVIQLIRTPPE